MENDLALHARDSTPVPGQGVIASQGADRYSRVIMLTTAWIRRDIDGDGEEEIDVVTSVEAEAGEDKILETKAEGIVE